MGSSSDGGWRPCSGGEFRKLGSRLTARRQRRLALALTLGIGGTIVSGMTVAAVAQHISEAIYANSQHGSSCPSQVAPACPPASNCLPTASPK